MTTVPLRLGISRCLLGDPVRYDGGHKKDPFLTEVLGPYVEWVPICPEVEAGLGTPREAMRLVRRSHQAQQVRLVTITSGVDHTRALMTTTARRLEALEDLDLSGYVFKKNSPSCGLERVRVYNEEGTPIHSGAGLFAQAFRAKFPLIPVEEEGRLCDPGIRENFIERVFCYQRYRQLLRTGVTRQGMVRFHTIHKYLLLAHSPQDYEKLGRLVAQAHRYGTRELAAKYGSLFMKALTIKATVRKHVNVLHHIVGHFKDRLRAEEKSELLSVIGDYQRGLTPLIVPLTLIKHYVQRFDVEYVRDQIYLNPHPKELMLRNHV
ncbi:MAG: DUF523 and DUF1722 domain-containing protein [Nitrospira sp.]|nr:DUF523 and DUF1722 domain-containing protein [Nitrospira sp.]MCP9441861.1 DUF523 and DUF1722 domain-containing protein [Nitrospira sp.]